MDALRTLIDGQRSLHDGLVHTVGNLTTQVGALPASAGTGGHRQPKISEPPKFSGADKKSAKLQEWLNQLSIWFAHEAIVTDRQHIVTALSRLEGAAHKYMGSYYEIIERGADPGTWEDFKNELRQIYEQRDDKEGAKREISKLFENKTLANHNFIKYAEHFCTLGRLTGYEDSLLVDKLRHVVPQDLRMCLIGAGRNAPTKWTQFLDLLLAYYKELHPEKSQGIIFDTGSKDNGSTPMDIDCTEKRMTKKGKEKAMKSIRRKRRRNTVPYTRHTVMRPKSIVLTAKLQRLLNKKRRKRKKIIKTKGRIETPLLKRR